MKPIIDGEFEVKSIGDANLVLGDLHRLSSELQGLAAALDGELQAARSRYEGKIKNLDAVINLRRTSLEQWAKANPAEFGDKKSLDLLHGSIGFRLSPRKLKLRAKSKWDNVVEVLKKFRGGIFARESFEVDKLAILAAEADGKLSTADQQKIGVRVVQDENFFVELKAA